MNYKLKDFISKEPQNDTLIWISSDKKFSITTTTNQWSKYFVYVRLKDTYEWIGVSTDELSEAVDELNKMIESEEIQKYESH